MGQSDRKLPGEENRLVRVCILALACGFGFACGGTVNPAGTPLVKVTPKSSTRPAETPAQATPSTAVETAVPDSKKPAASPETFQDSFDEPGGWGEEQTDRYSMGRAEGNIYRMEFFLAGDDQVLLSLQPHAFSLPLRDMIVRAEGTGMNEAGAYGLVCRYSDPENFYTFHISIDGRYWLYKKMNGAWTNLNSAVSNEILEVNMLELNCAGNTIAASVNGVVVAEAVDDSLPEGNAGLFAQPLGGDVAGAWSYYAMFTSFEMTVYP